MTFFRRRLRDRFTDVLDWMDYRQGPNAWPLFAIPPMVSVAWAYGGWIGAGIIVAFAITVALLSLVLGFVALVAWTVGNATKDALANLSPELVLGERANKSPAATVR